MNLGSILNFAINGAAAVYQAVHGKKPQLTDIIPLVIGQLLPSLSQAIDYGQLSTEAQIDAWAATLDAKTGVDVGALDVNHSMPPDKQEEMFDGFKQFAVAFAKNKAKIPGYYIAA
jgi:hypothetical protein